MPSQTRNPKDPTRRHDTGWPRFALVVQTATSDQSHRIYVRCQGRVDSHDARGPEWEVVQYRPLKGEAASPPPVVHGTSRGRAGELTPPKRGL
jgi:hypothetical protein